MGLAIDRDCFEPEDHRRFAARLQAGLLALAEVLRRPGFGEGAASIGAEVEFSLVDEHGRPLRVNQSVLAETNDPRLTVELNQYNLECNSRPLPLAGRPFTALGAELSGALAEAGRAAGRHGARTVFVGILPTLRAEDVSRDAMTDLPRFRALSAEIRRLRHAPFELHIAGDDPLVASMDDVTAEGANTSLQIHLRVAAGDFARTHAAAQIATAPALAAAGNSPLFLGHRLWEETRIALFKQAVDERGDLSAAWHPSARVSFGHGWVRESAYELFAESVALYPPLLPMVGSEDPVACLRAGGVPQLDELRLHHGTVWRWNRAVFDPAGGGHLRIELRALPSGPTLADMLANAAFLLGLTLGLRDEIDWMLPALPFEHAHRNFYRAAQHGLDALLLWPSPEPPSPRPVRAAELVPQLLPVAQRGLVAAGVDDDEAAHWLAPLAGRVASGQTGARWQRRMLALLEKSLSREDALPALVLRYQAASAAGRPVHEWPLAP
jgi:gamma-glutamyl:cysteine ligase YbdK (ATP-grasp superfamily)